jgi:restriction system protein
MSIPDFQSIMLPLLQITASLSELQSKDALLKISEHFHLTDSEKNELLPSGKQEIIVNRIAWAKFYLKKAGLIATPRRGISQITERGANVLKQSPSVINISYLNQFPEFVEFRSTHSGDTLSATSEKYEDSAKTPEELLEISYQELKKSIINELILKMKSGTPKFFENLIVDTIVKLGYGGSRKEAGRAIGQSGDEGIDGIIHEDRLGLDVIYLQAKRWEANIGRPEIQKFAGALQGKRARKGIFITTSDFTNEAKEFAKNIESRIILLSGQQLAELMWEKNIGLSATASYEIKRIDEDFFLED